MTRTSREDMIVISMGVDTLLECVRSTEAWCRSRGGQRGTSSHSTTWERDPQHSSEVLCARRRLRRTDR